MVQNLFSIPPKATDHSAPAIHVDSSKDHLRPGPGFSKHRGIPRYTDQVKDQLGVQPEIDDRHKRMSFKDPIKILPLGALIQEIPILTSAGDVRNIVLSLPSPSAYQTHNRPYFGETIGRVANRISDGVIRNLNGKDWELAQNNGPNCLHGGKQGWGKQLWEVIRSSAEGDHWRKEYRHQSQHLEEGFPGAVHATVAYEVRSGDLDTALEGKPVKDMTIDIEFEACMAGQAQSQDNVHETVVSMTNHSYFNVSDGTTTEGTEATMRTTAHLQLGERAIPTGTILPTFDDLQVNVPFKFTETFPKMDHFFVLNEDPASIPLDTRSLPLREFITLYHPSTGIHLSVSTTEPGVQVYTGDAIDVPAVDGQGSHEGTPKRGARAGVAIEPGRYTNATNQEGWREMVLLRRDKTWGGKLRYTIWSD